MKTLVVKVGGSLLRSPVIISNIANILARLKPGKVIVPGGGIFADVVRKLFVEHKITSEEAHYMAIKAMEIHSVMLSYRLRTSKLCSTLEEIVSTLSEGKIAIVLPYEIIRKVNILPESWSITSDSIAVLIGILLGADLVVLLKNVDGVYVNGKVVKELKAGSVSTLKGYADDYVLELIRRFKVKVAIVNGLKPEILKYLVSGRECPQPYTLITA